MVAGACCRIDHVVVAARDLESGSKWVEARLGAAPTGGGEHPKMATHNRVLSLGSTYLEVIAVNPAAPPPTRPRWFDLDNPWLQAALEAGPRVITWAVNTPRLDELGLPAEVWGRTEPMSRGDYHWCITIPADGRLPACGLAPTVLEWISESPVDAMPDRGCRLAGLQLRHPRAVWLESLLRGHRLYPDGVGIDSGSAAIEVLVDTPRGRVVLA